MRKGSEPGGSWLCGVEERALAGALRRICTWWFCSLWGRQFLGCHEMGTSFEGRLFHRVSLEAAYGPLLGRGFTLNGTEVLLCFTVRLLSGLKTLWGGLVLSQSLLDQRRPAVFLGIGNVLLAGHSLQARA